jgi:hypothetical protein
MTPPGRIRQQIARVAAQMVAGEVELLEGCREIVSLRSSLKEPELYDPDLLAMVGVESELDDVPTGAARALWDTEALTDKDRKKDRYLQSVRDSLIDNCLALVAKWGPTA